MFYFYLAPLLWRPLFTFSKRVERRFVGLDGPGLTYVRSKVVPMGWGPAMGVAQHVHRRQVLWPQKGAGLPPELEIRRDRICPVPMVGDRRNFFQVYADNLDTGTILPVE